MSTVWSVRFANRASNETNSKCYDKTIEGNLYCISELTLQPAFLQLVIVIAMVDIAFYFSLYKFEHLFFSRFQYTLGF